LMLRDGEDVDVHACIVGWLDCVISVDGVDGLDFVAEVFGHEDQ